MCSLYFKQPKGFLPSYKQPMSDNCLNMLSRSSLDWVSSRAFCHRSGSSKSRVESQVHSNTTDSLKAHMHLPLYRVMSGSSYGATVCSSLAFLLGGSVGSGGYEGAGTPGSCRSLTSLMSYTRVASEANCLM